MRVGAPTDPIMYEFFVIRYWKVHFHDRQSSTPVLGVRPAVLLLDCVLDTVVLASPAIISIVAGPTRLESGASGAGMIRRR